MIFFLSLPKNHGSRSSFQGYGRSDVDIYLAATHTRSFHFLDILASTTHHGSLRVPITSKCPFVSLKLHLSPDPVVRWNDLPSQMCASLR